MVELAKERRSAIAASPDEFGWGILDINDPEPKYTLRSLPGTFSGLHLCCLMYAAFKKFAPAQDVGIDFSREWMQVNRGR